MAKKNKYKLPEKQICCGLCGKGNVTLYKTFLGYVCKEHRDCCYFDENMIKEKELKKEN